MYKIMQTPEFGRGLYATQDIKKGDLIMSCELLILSQADTLVVNTTELKYYTFKYDELRDCLVLGLGEIFNHSDYENVNYKLVDLIEESRTFMHFYAKTDIFEGEQLFINYNADIKSDTNAYKNNKSLVR